MRLFGLFEMITACKLRQPSTLIESLFDAIFIDRWALQQTARHETQSEAIKSLLRHGRIARP